MFWFSLELEGISNEWFSYLPSNYFPSTKACFVGSFSCVTKICITTKTIQIVHCRKQTNSIESRADLFLSAIEMHELPLHACLPNSIFELMIIWKRGVDLRD